MDCCPTGSSDHGILQARILEWVAIPFSRGSSGPRDQILVSCIGGRFFTVWASRATQKTQGTENGGLLGLRTRVCVCVCVCVSRSVVSDSLWVHGLQATRFLCPWNSPCKNPGVGCHSFLQGIFLTQGSNPGLLHCRQILFPLSHQESPNTCLIYSVIQPNCYGSKIRLSYIFGR